MPYFFGLREKKRTLWYYDAVVQVLADGWESPLLDELKVAVEELQAL